MWRSLSMSGIALNYTGTPDEGPKKIDRRQVGSVVQLDFLEEKE